MKTFLSIILIIMLLAVVGVLFLGVFSMSRGGEFNRKHGNRLMRWRIILQGAAVAVIMFSLFYSQDW